MPISDTNTNLNRPPNSTDEPTPLQNFEIPLPFGYHMDLDFVRFCSEDTMISEETLDRLKDLRRQRREEIQQANFWLDLELQKMIEF